MTCAASPPAAHPVLGATGKSIVALRPEGSLVSDGSPPAGARIHLLAGFSGAARSRGAALTSPRRRCGTAFSRVRWYEIDSWRRSRGQMRRVRCSLTSTQRWWAIGWRRWQCATLPSCPSSDASSLGCNCCTAAYCCIRCWLPWQVTLKFMSHVQATSVLSCGNVDFCQTTFVIDWDLSRKLGVVTSHITARTAAQFPRREHFLAGLLLRRSLHVSSYRA